ncbi:penicillin-binding protein 2 [Alcanivorax xiamenensis]|uniref:Peptidoglycan D,D-transpeptidase MrdA n=1 Tax=Alcanivorax xiamenensis TaxID=1177156 RepID=A0ABQ6YBL5_9GAMM|nr:penicillin-binding protein 2 [Alcanivorax xiamenensis]KAF0807425.1 penicillin-binding protein 2 [Alcanivorax xiamenensis]
MRQPLTLKDHHHEHRLFSLRLLVAVALVLVLSLVLVGRMAWLQIAQHSRFTTLSDNNRVLTQAMSPPRGLITDRNGEILAVNRPDFTLELAVEQSADLNDTLDRIRRLIPLTDDDLERFERRRTSARRPWEPIPLRGRLTEEEIARIAVHQHELPGARVTASPVRFYPHSHLFSHVLGYVNRLSAEDLDNMTLAEQRNYSGTHYYGRTGVERYYEHRLHGQVGYRQVETNARGRILRVLEEQPPIPGDDLRLSLDLKVQQAAYDALGERRGAVVAIDPRDGSVLAFVSRPGFDPNLFVTGISHKDYARYQQDHDHPLFNRALQGRYPPGSTVKPMLGLAGLDAGVTNWERTIHDPGYFSLEGNPHRYRDWKRWGHGQVDMEKAVVQSCDTYFYDMGFRLGIDRMHDFMIGFSIGEATGIDLLNESEGNMPSRQWKRAARNAPWFHGDTINTSIGQGFMLTTPLQLAVATAILANDGHQVVPTLAADETHPPRRPDIVLKDPRDWERMKHAMEAVVHSNRGTGRVMAKDARYHMGAKSGTAQVFSVGQEETYNEAELAERMLDHALIVSFAPVENPAIAVAVMVENGRHGGSVAGPVARQVMDAWLLNEDGDLHIPEPLARPPIQNGPPAPTTTASTTSTRTATP